MSTNSELHLDFETKSEIDLTQVGAHAYFEHPSTDIWCAGYSFDDEEPEIWHPGESIPKRLKNHIEAGAVIAAWNAAFERLALRCVLTPRYGWPAVADRQFRCTMTEALGMNIPAKLKDAAPALGMEMEKDEKGHRLMMQMCKPRKPKKNEIVEGAIWWDDAERRARLDEYCKQDVRVEAEIGKRILRLRPMEQKLYFLDMKINDRGVYIDDKLCRAAESIVESSMERLDQELARITKNEVRSCSSVAQLTRWLKSRGVDTDSVDRESIEDLLILEIPDDCRRALEIRQEGSKTSTSKISTMLRRRQRDGRMRGNLQFYGASATGRWAARGAQLQNLTRPVILRKTKKSAPLEEQIATAIDYIHGGSSVLIELVYGKPLTLIADCVRSMVAAPPGRLLRSSDFSNIEGRGVAWLAGQEDKLDAFRACDAGTGPDLYLVAASGIYNIPINECEDDPHRKIGKVAELALGYQGGPKAFAKMAKAYGVRIGQYYDGIWENAGSEFKDIAESAWDERGRKSGMSREAWLAAEVIKLAWRAKNWRIEQYWREVEDAAIAAVHKPGEIFPAGKVKFKKQGSFLFCLLPSGRGLCYPYPRLKDVETPWGATRAQIRYKAVDQFTKQWTDKAYYGGLGVENITQAISRDIMAEAMLRVEEAGYDVILTVHDEIVVETDKNFGSLEEFNALMTELPHWAAGFPITAGGWEGTRYRKG